MPDNFASSKQKQTSCPTQQQNLKKKKKKKESVLLTLYLILSVRFKNRLNSRSKLSDKICHLLIGRYCSLFSLIIFACFVFVLHRMCMWLPRIRYRSSTKKGVGIRRIPSREGTGTRKWDCSHWLRTPGRLPCKRIWLPGRRRWRWNVKGKIRLPW